MSHKTKTTSQISENRKARYDYFIEDTYEAGIILQGTEVKSLRRERPNLNDAHASCEEGELWLHNLHISEYTEANRFNHFPRRKRKLLMKKREIAKLAGLIDRKQYTLIPLKLYFNERNIAKVQLALSKGKQKHDKRATIKNREWERDKARIMRT